MIFYMVFVEIMVFVGSFVVSLLYVWLGLAYAIALMLVLHCMGFKVSFVMPVVLASQIVAALLGSILRGRSSVYGGFRSPLIIAVAAIAAYASASFLGVALSDDVRLWGIEALLIIAIVLNLSGEKRASSRSRLNDLPISIAAGLSSGVVKGVLGGGITPMLIAIQRLGGVDIDVVLFRTLFAQVIMCMTAFVPYTLAFGFDFKLFALLSLGSLMGVVLGYRLLAPLSKELRVKLVSLVMGLLALALFIKLLLEVICVWR